MPELPEVETVVCDLEGAGFIGLKVRGLRVFSPGVVLPAGAELEKSLKGARTTAVSRRGKFIVMGFSNGLFLLFHLRMTGKIIFPADTSSGPGKHDHVELLLSGKKSLVFHDPRRFGRCTLTHAPREILDRLGPEPLSREFTLPRFRKMLAATRRMLKPLLLDQGFIAGLGNIYTDEALFAARLHPQRSADSLSSPEQAALRRAVRAVLRRGIRNRGTSLGRAKTNFMSIERGHGGNQKTLKVFRRTGLACPRCGRAVERIVVAQRSTHFCPVCQPLKKGKASHGKAESE